MSATDTSTSTPVLLRVPVEILGEKTEVPLPYAKEAAYLDHVARDPGYDDAFRNKAPALLSARTSVADRLARIDQLRASTHATFVKNGGNGRDPVVGSFDGALEDLVMAYFNLTKDAIVASTMTTAEKRAALAELKLDNSKVLDWAPTLKASISFYAVEGELALGSAP